MRHFTRPGSEATLPPASPRSASPVFVAGMGRRMAAAGLRPRPALGRADVALARPAVEPAFPAHAPRILRSGAATILEPGTAARICQAAALCTLAASGASLLYWQKARATLQEREIGRTLQAVREVHARTAVLRTEWAALDEPGRLQEMADRLLALRPIAPAQFVEPAALPAWLQSPVPAPPAPAADPDVPTAPEATVPPAPERPAFRTRLAAAAPALPMSLPTLPLPPAPPRAFLARPTPRAVLTAALPTGPGPHLAREPAAPRFEMPRWLTQGRSPRPTVLALSEPPHALALPPALRPAPPAAAPPVVASLVVAPPRAPAAPPRPFAVIAATSGDAAYEDRPAGWYPRAVPAWPYGAPARPPYGWVLPYGYGQPYLPY